MKHDINDEVFDKFKCAKIFDCMNPYFDLDPMWNFTFLRMKERYFNDSLRSKGYVLLNEVYEALGFEKVDEFENIGWIYREKYREKDPIGDNFIDFGLHNNPYITCDSDKIILLEFNVDGVIRF